MADSSHVQKHIVYPRDLGIAWSENSLYWSWFPQQYEESRYNFSFLFDFSSETTVETAVLRAVCWLEVNGKFDTRELTPETKYEVVYVVKLQDTARGWETPVNLKLTLPNSNAMPQERSVILEEHIGESWVDISVGEFITSPENTGEISFSLYETETNAWKTGLVVKGVEIRRID